MSAHDSNDDFWRGKARALLWPSPFYRPHATSQDEDEQNRLDTLTALLGAPDDGERRLLDRCRRDAQDATQSFDEQGLPERRPEMLALLHPLSAVELGRHARKDFYASEDKLLEAPELHADHWDADRYRALWYRVMHEQPFPGSTVVRDHSVQAYRTLCTALYGARWSGPPLPEEMGNDQQAALLYLHVGPVQKFIRTSRRMHDFWMASFTLGYLTFQGARALAEELGPDAVVMPDLASLPLAKKILFGHSVEPTELLRSSLANKVLAVVPWKQAQGLAERAAARIRKSWTEMAEGAKGALTAAAEHAGLAEALGTAELWHGWEAQIDAHLEIEAVVQPWPTRRDEMRVLAERLPVHGEQAWWRDESIQDGEQRTGFAYGALFDRCHRLRASMSGSAPPAHVPGDHRPKCSQTGEHEQMGPTVDAWTQFSVSRKFFEQLSEALSGYDARSRSDTDTVAPRAGAAEPPEYSFQITRGEGLSAVALTKRLAPMAFYGTTAAELGIEWRKLDERPHLRFPAVVTIAAAPLMYCLHNHRRLLEQLTKDERERHDCQRNLDQAIPAWQAKLKDLQRTDCLDFTPPGNLLPGLDPEIGRDDRVIDHDGQWFYESTYVPTTAWQNRYHGNSKKEDEKKRLVERMPEARSRFLAMSEALGMKASPYYAMIVLDGDHMGKWLTGRHEGTPRLGAVLPQEVRAQIPAERLDKPRPLFPALHAELSQRLGKLSQAVHKVVENYLGRVIYSGGDDVVAFVPVATALRCLRAIEREIQKNDHLGDRVTVSAGLAVVHMRSPMSRALELARGAESKAKVERDRFVVAVDRRSGETLEVVLPWRIDTPEIDVIEAVIEVLMGARDEDGHPLARTDVAYRLAQEAPALAGLPDDMFFPAVCARIEGLLAGTKGPAPKVRLVRALLEYGMNPPGDHRAALRRVIDVLLVIRFLLSEEHGIPTGMLLKELQNRHG
jgi:CRISPR-associated protein